MLIRCMTNRVCVFFLIALIGSPAFAESVSAPAFFRNVVKLNAAFSGLLHKIHGQPGVRFEKGQLLIEQDQGPFKTRLDQAAVQDELLAQQLTEAEGKFERDEELFDEGSMSLVEFDLARLELEKIRTARFNAAVKLKSARYQQGLSRRVAPFDGVILDIGRTEGEYINASVDAPYLMTIAEVGAYMIEIGVPADEAAQYPLGRELEVSRNGQSWTGRIGSIHYPVSGQVGSIVSVRVHFDVEQGSLVAGQTFTVALP